MDSQTKTLRGLKTRHQQGPRWRRETRRNDAKRRVMDGVDAKRNVMDPADDVEQLNSHVFDH